MLCIGLVEKTSAKATSKKVALCHCFSLFFCILFFVPFRNLACCCASSVMTIDEKCLPEKICFVGIDILFFWNPATWTWTVDDDVVLQPAHKFEYGVIELVYWSLRAIFNVSLFLKNLKFCHFFLVSVFKERKL